MPPGNSAPSLRIGTKPARSRSAVAAPGAKPRASTPATCVTPASRTGAATRSATAARSGPDATSPQRSASPSIQRNRAATTARARATASPCGPVTVLRRGERGAEVGELVDVAVDVGLRVLHRQGPLLLVAGRHEDAAVHRPRVGRQVQLRVGVEEVAIVPQRLERVRPAALRAG